MSRAHGEPGGHSSLCQQRAHGWTGACAVCGQCAPCWPPRWTCKFSAHFQGVGAEVGGVVVRLAWAPACGPVGRLGATRVLGASGLCAGRACVGQLGRPPQPCQQVVPGDGLRESSSAEFNLHVAPWREGRPAFCFRARLMGWDFKWDNFG